MPELNSNPVDPVGIFLSCPLVDATSENLPYRNWKELVGHSKKKTVLLGRFRSVTNYHCHNRQQQVRFCERKLPLTYRTVASWLKGT